MVIETGGLSAPEDMFDVQTLLLEAYRHIGEPDSVYGACSTHVAKDTTRLLLYEHEGEWHKSLSESVALQCLCMVGSAQTFPCAQLKTQ